MHRIPLLTLVGLSFMMPATLAAQEEQAPVASEAPAKPEPKICKKNRATGSLTRVNKICLTRTQWNEVNRQTKDSIDNFTSRQNGHPGEQRNPMGG